MDKKTVRTRFAPSPTGELHIGAIRTVLFCYALARKYNGKFLIRIEDTDQKRYVEGAEKRLLDMIKSYGISYDEGPDIGGPFAPYTQSERLEIYTKHSQMLLDSGHAYICFCTAERLEKLRAKQLSQKLPPKYDELCRSLSKEEVEKRKSQEKYVIRFKIPHDERITVKDEITGDMNVDTNNLDDYILMKSDGFPTYHLAAIVDDHLMEITHVFRGVEWKPSLPKNILLFRAFNWDPPKYIHPSVILNSNKPGKLSKRDGSVSAESFLIEGYLPEAMLNFLMLLGWAPKDNREIYSLDEFVEAFNLEGLQSSSPRFNRKKLEWMNGEYIRKCSTTNLTAKFIDWLKNWDRSDDELKDILIKCSENNSDKLASIVALLQTRASTLLNIKNSMKFFFVSPNHEYNLMEIKGIKNYEKEILKNAKEELFNLIQSLGDSNSWNHETWENGIRQIASKLNIKDGDLFMLLRLIIVGDVFSPPLFESMVILGSEESIVRIKNYNQ